MKKISTKFVLAAAATFTLGTAMAQTDTTKLPEPDTTKTPTDTIPTDSTAAHQLTIHSTTSTMMVAQLGKFSSDVYAITNRELLNSKQYDIKTEEEIEA